MKTRKHFSQSCLHVFDSSLWQLRYLQWQPGQKHRQPDSFFKGNGKSTVTIKDTQCYSGRNLKVNYIKFKPSVTGTVTLKFDCSSSYYNIPRGMLHFAIKIKRRSVRKNEIWRNDYAGKIYNTTTYGVKKNTTYYFAVQCNAVQKSQLTVKAIKDSSASSKSKQKHFQKERK